MKLDVRRTAMNKPPQVQKVLKVLAASYHVKRWGKLESGSQQEEDSRMEESIKWALDIWDNAVLMSGESEEVFGQAVIERISTKEPWKTALKGRV